MNLYSDVSLIANQIIPAKISLPHHQVGAIQRKQLRSMLEGVFTHRLTLVCAPAGYGKTTLVSDWVAEQEIPVAWLSLTKEDNQLPVFLSYLAAALKKANPDFGNCIEEALHQVHDIDLPSLMGPLLQEMDQISPAMLLVLDDFHLIQNPEIQDMIQFLLQNCNRWAQPDAKESGCHILLISRSDLPFSISKWRLHQELIEIGIDELKFSLAETEEFIKLANQPQMQPDHIQKLASQTEGWVTGLQLCLLGMKSNSHSQTENSEIRANNQLLVDYLMEEVIQDLPAEIRQFLLQTSILEYMTSDLCDQIRGQTDSQQILAWLDHANLFILPMDDQQGWYRYHQLFRDVLLNKQLALGEAALQTYHNRAARWLEENGFIRESLRHWLAAENLNEASRMLAKEAPVFLNTSQYVILRELFEALPEKCFSQNPWLCVLHAWSYAILMESMLSHRLDQAMEIINSETGQAKYAEAEIREIRGNVYTILALHEARLGEDEKTFDYATKALDLLPLHSLNVRGLALIAIAKIYFRNGELDQALNYLSEAIESLQQGENISGITEALYLMGEILRKKGKLNTAYQTFQKAIFIVESHHRSNIFLRLSNASLSSIELEWGHLEKAEEFLQKSSEKHGFMGGVNEVRVGIAQVETNLGLHKHDEAEAAVRDLEPYLEYRTLSRFSKHDLNGFLLRYYSGQKDFQIAQNIIDDGQISSIQPGDFLHEQELIGLAYYYWMSAQWNLLVELLDRMIPILKGGKRYDGAIRMETLYAVALFQMGETEKAAQLFLTALDEGLREGYFWTYVSFGEPVIGLINAIHETSNLLDHINIDPCRLQEIGILLSQRIYEENDREKAAVDRKALHMLQTEPIANPLSEKETLILKYLITGNEYKTIAAELRLSVATVRTHVYHIFGKLGAHNRVEAIIKAKEMKLLS